MAKQQRYNKKEVLEIAKKAIIENKLFFIDDIVAFIPISRGTFYNWGFDKLDELKALLDVNKTTLKVSMRSKWYKSNSPALQMALMKLVASPEELKKLAMNFIESENTNNNVNREVKELTEDKLKAFNKALEDEY
jgi:hypothetical protein